VNVQGSINNSGFRAIALAGNLGGFIYSGSTGIVKSGTFVRYFDYESQTKLKENHDPKGYVLTGSGVFSSTIFETCHGISYTDLNIGPKTGQYNFYHAPYGAGYYHPPYGEFPTFAEEEYGVSLPFKKQADSLNLSDHLQVFGLRLTQLPRKKGAVVFVRCRENRVGARDFQLHAIHEGISDCPLRSQAPSKYDVLTPELSAGNFGNGLGIIGGNLYNHNAFPSSYDRGIHVVAATYQLIGKMEGEGEDARVVCKYSNDPPISNLGPQDSQRRSRNHSICTDPDRALGAGAVQAHYEATSPRPASEAFVPGEFGQDNLNHDPAIYWHFIFKNNHQTLPFGNTHEAAQMIQENDQTRENHWWEHRECPEHIDHLNHAYANNINACPMDYLDTPYYASLGKFGYFGARFQDTWRFVDLPKDYPDDPTGQEYESRTKNIGGSNYDILLNQAAIETQNYSWFITDRLLFLHLNKAIILTTPEYQALANSIPNFAARFGALCDAGATGRNLTTPASGLFFIDRINRGTETNVYDEDPINFFEKDLKIIGQNDSNNFKNLIKKYASFKIIDNQGNVDVVWYNAVTNQKRKRIATRYYSNIVSGKPVDLFPDGQITFSFESGLNFANSNYIKYATLDFNNPSAMHNEKLPVTRRRYFSTSFLPTADISGNIAIAEQVKFKNAGHFGAGFTYNNNLITAGGNFYLGNPNRKKFGNDLVIPDSTNTFLQLINLPRGGHWDTFAPETSPAVVNAARNLPRAGWPSNGYGRVGRLNANFSCFSPLFLQQPKTEYVKLRQPPTFRVYALDYHSIPEEKINENSKADVAAYPEVDYWLRKTKTISSKGKNLYPLKYKWYRVLRTNASNYYKFKTQSFLEASSITGNWCCAEGDGPDCTVIRPSECERLADGAQMHLPINNPLFSEGIVSEEDTRVFMGPSASDANNYYYFCRVEGRFGWRDSEFGKIEQDNTVTASVAVYSPVGGLAVSMQVGSLSFSFNSNGGVMADGNVKEEEVKDRNWNDRNNCETFRFVGNEGVRGVTRVYTPSTFFDPRGKTVRDKHYQEFGQIVNSTLTINDAQAIQLYCHRALPACNVTANAVPINPTWPGVPISFPGWVHRTRFVKAIFSTDSKFGARYDRIRNVAELYPPIQYRENNLIGFTNVIGRNPGHAQFQENLGAIKIYSRNISLNGNATVGYNTSLFGNNSKVDVAKPQDKSELTRMQEEFIGQVTVNATGGSDSRGTAIKNTTITGPECGYVDPSAGRLMHFYVETFSTYYILCESGGIKPKRIKNHSHIAGGLRTGRPGLQYNFLGKPNNARLKWTSMPGPYAFQWKVERHNRDRNGNGMPLCFYSYLHEARIDNLYDAAAVYGALRRVITHGFETQNATKLQFLRSAALPANSARALAGTIGPDDGRKLGCGGTRFKITVNDNGTTSYRPNKEYADYLSFAEGYGPSISSFGCPPNDASCFPPCISLKYPNGYDPKGAKSAVGRQNKYRFITTPYAANTSSPPLHLHDYQKDDIQIKRIRMTPCEDGPGFNKDLCNYLTPTLHVGIDTWAVGVAIARIDQLILAS